MARNKLGFAPQIVKYLVLSINAVSLFAGILLTIVGAYVSNADRTITGVTSSYLPTGLICLGAFISAVSLLGCFGAQKEIGSVLKIYFFLLASLVFFQIVLGAMAFVKLSEADTVLDNQWTNALKSDPGLVYDIEKMFNCCGFANVTDRPNPPECAIELKTTTSCKDALTAAFQENLHLMGVIGLVMGLFEFLGLAFSFVLFSRIRKIYDEARDAALLNKAKELEAQGKIDID